MNLRSHGCEDAVAAAVNQFNILQLYVSALAIFFVFTLFVALYFSFSIPIDSI